MEKQNLNNDHITLFVHENKHPNTINNESSIETQPKKNTSSSSSPSSTEAKPPPNPHHAPARTQTLRGLSFSKPKSRFVEFNLPNNNHHHEEITQAAYHPNPHQTHHSSLSSDSEDGEEDSDSDCEEHGWTKKQQKKKRKFKWRLFMEWVLFLIILTCLLCSLTISSLKNKFKWGLEIWKWCLMVMVTFSGRLVSGWVVRLLVFVIERNFMLREKVLYFVYGLRKSFQNCIWLGLVLLAWTFMFNAKIHDKQRDHEVLKKVFQGLVAVLIDSMIWLIKVVLVKMLASSFHVATYFDRMKESVFLHYVLDTLSGPPMDEVEYQQAHHNNNHLIKSRSLPTKLRESRIMSRSKRDGSRRIDMEKLRKLSTQGTASAWSVKRLANYVRSYGLSTISRTVDEFGRAESEITSEWEARNCARRIFKHVAKPGAKYIEEEDLMRFLKQVEIHTIFPMFECALETGKISKSAFTNWVVRAYRERKSLAYSLNDTKTAVQQLHKLASAVVSVIIVVVTLLVMGFATTGVIAFFLTQVLLIGFTFQNTCKTIFESIIFVFVMHPYDIGDRCIIDGVQMIVEEMNILTTVFLLYDNEKIYYPNAVLITKPISNFYRSPEMNDAIEFAIDMSTSIDMINALRKAIQTYIESKSKYWNANHSVIVKEIENVNTMKMALCVQHTINHQNYGDRNNRITELILELKKIFESLGIKYHLLPQEVHLTQVNAGSWRENVRLN